MSPPHTVDGLTHRANAAQPHGSPVPLDWMGSGAAAMSAGSRLGERLIEGSPLSPTRSGSTRSIRPLKRLAVSRPAPWPPSAQHAAVGRQCCQRPHRAAERQRADRIPPIIRDLEQTLETELRGAHECFCPCCAREQGTQQGQMEWRQAAEPATGLVATEAQPSPSGAWPRPPSQRRRYWVSLLRMGGVPPRREGSAAPPHQPDSRELAAAVSAEALSSTPQAKAEAIVSPSSALPPCAGCRLDGLLHPGQGTASAGQAPSAWATRPPPRETTRLSTASGRRATWSTRETAAPRPLRPRAGADEERTSWQPSTRASHTDTRVTRSDGERPAPTSPQAASRCKPSDHMGSHGRVDEAGVAANDQ